MVRGTTAQFEFKLPYSKNDIELAEVDFRQPGNEKGLNQDYPLPITKVYRMTKADDGALVTNYPWNWADNYTLMITLGQQETLTFCDRYKAFTQIRIRTTSGTVLANARQNITVYPSPWDDPLGIDLPTADDEWVVLDGQTVSEAGDA